jgi:hypothetical protein
VETGGLSVFGMIRYWRKYNVRNAKKPKIIFNDALLSLPHPEWADFLIHRNTSACQFFPRFSGLVL